MSLEQVSPANSRFTDCFTLIIIIIYHPGLVKYAN
jgi:hypothetical protein